MPRWINLQDHTIALTYGDRKTVPQGKWFVLRIFRIGEYSEHWDPDRKEAYGGEKYRYDDFVVRDISKIGQISKNQAGTMQAIAPVIDFAGYEDVSTKTFAIVRDDRFPRDPQIGDVIHEIEEFDCEDEPLPPLHSTGKYKIVNTIPEPGDYGRNEVLFLFVQLLTGES